MFGSLALALLALSLFGRPAAEDALPPQKALEAALRESVRVACGGRTVETDADLARAAVGFVQAVASGRAPLSERALAFYAALESSEPTPFAGVATVEPPGRADRAVADLFPHECHFNRGAIAAATLAGGKAVVAVLTAQHATDLARIPGQVEVGAPLQISGTLAPGLSVPRLFVARPSGSVEEQPIAVTSGRLSAQAVLREKGEYTLELLAQSASGPEVAAIRRVFAGIPPPSAPPPERTAAKLSEVAGVESEIARVRAAHGLPPLQRDPALDAVAEGHSREMARTGIFAHILPSDGSLSDRLARAGYAHRSAGENIGLAPDALAAHEAVASSPAHLANLLDPRHRCLGLGAARGMAEGAEMVYLTEVLALPIVGARDPAGEVLAVIQARRRKLGLAALQRDRSLDSIAEREVRAVALAGGPLPKADGPTTAALEANPEIRSAAAEMFVGGSPEEAERLKNAADANWTRFGVGAIYASSKTYGPGRLWVLVLFAR